VFLFLKERIMKKTIIALLFMFSIVLVGCEDAALQDVGPDPEGENPPSTESEAEAGAMPDPGPETEDNATDG
jgi:hypothetical protein